MAQMTLPTAPTVHTTIYGDLKGVDFSNDPAIVYKKRSPSSVNMISDKGGNPKKRTGWKVEFSESDFKSVYQTTKSIEVKNLYSFELGGKRHLVIFTNVAAFVEQDSTLKLLTDLSEAIQEPYRGFFFESSNGDAGFYFFGGEKLWAYKHAGGENFSVSPVSAYVPEIRIWDGPNGSSTMLDGVNLLTRRVKEKYIGDDKSLNYYVSFPISQSEPVTVRVKNNGTWSVLTNGYTVDHATHRVTFTSAKIPVPSNEDNVEIEYAIDSKPDNVKNFFKCKTLAVFGNGLIDSVFLSGCEDSNYSSYAWYSKAGDPTYWPDTNYFIAGSNDTKVMGFMKIGEYLGIVKEGAASDSTIYLAYPTSYDNETTYATRQAVSGVGAVSSRCFSVLGDEPLFLSKEGICGVAATNASTERSIKNRSFYVNKKLLEEPGLENAVATTWDGFYLVCVNSHCYVLDSRQKSSWQTEWTNYLYECYYWDNVPASCMVEHGGALWFGTENGRVCRFKEENEEGAYNDDGEPIFAEWSTPVDNDGATQLFKTLQKKGSLVTIQPGRTASVDLYLSADGQEETYLGRQYADRFYWNALNFRRFPFTSNMAPKDFYMNKKKKKYKRLQIILRNNEPNEGFAVYEIVKLYTVGNYSKRKSGEGVWR